MKGAECLLHWPESEAVGWVLLEAMMVGLPVIATDTGGIPEVIDHGQTGLLIPVGDIGAGAAAILSLIGERSRAKALADAAAVAVRERHKASTMVDALAEVYRKVHRGARA